MHHGHFELAIFLIFMVAYVLFMAGCMWGGLKLRKRLFAGPARDEWQDAGRRLDRKGRWSVRWATQRRRPVDRAGLAAAQLAFIGYAQDTIKRSPLRRGWLRVAFPVFYAGLGALNIAIAFTQSHPPVIAPVLGVFLCVFAIAWALAFPRAMDRQARRLEKLHGRICRRYGDLSALDSPAE